MHATLARANFSPSMMLSALMITSLMEVDLLRLIVRKTNFGKKTTGVYVPGAMPDRVDPPLVVSAVR